MIIQASVCIAAFNEEKNITHLIESIQRQKLKSVKLSEIIVVSSGSTDRTNEIVKQLAKKDKRLKLITQKKRLGKASAVNILLERSSSEIIVLSGADLIIPEESLELLLKPFQSKKIGIVGARPVPVNSPLTFMGYAAHFLWNLHHELATRRPKMGELIAFRKIFRQIPPSTSVDEANIEPLIRGQGYLAHYVPKAIVYNRGPDTIREFVARRRHIYFGHLVTKHEYGYEVSTYNPTTIFSVLPRCLTFSLKSYLWSPVVILLEVYSRILGYLDFKLGLKSHTVWEITPSTKKVKA